MPASFPKLLVACEWFSRAAQQSSSGLRRTSHGTHGNGHARIGTEFTCDCASRGEGSYLR